MTKKLRHKLFSVSLKDCDVQTFRAGGKGGQHQNKTETGVRIIHRASGAIGEGREFASQHRNKVAAFRRMAESAAFLTWAKWEATRITGGKSPEQALAEVLNDEDLLFEGYAEGQWHKIK